MIDSIQIQKPQEISTSVAARISGLNYRKILRLVAKGKINSRRASNAPQSPWLHQRDEVLQFANASH